jgi:hypothetical protein
VAFVHDFFNWKEREGCAPYQEEALSKLVTEKRVCLRSPHGVGKTALISWGVIWFAATNDEVTDWKVPITASAWRQLTKFAMPEVHKWVHRLKWEKINRPPFNNRLELLDQSLKLKTGEAFALASDNAAMIEGAHASRMLYIFDESKEIPVDIWDAAEGAFATGDCYWLAVSTPGEPNGRFFEIQEHKSGFSDWYVKHITMEEAVKAGRMRPEWIENRRTQWGENSAVFQNRVLGEFASSEESGVIPLSWVEAANRRWEEWNDLQNILVFTAVGVDVARSGEDKSVLALRFGNVITEIRANSLEDTMITTGRVVGVLTANKGKAVVDVIGIGAGVVDRLRELKFEVIPFNASEKIDAKDSSGELGFLNHRAYAWWNLRELLDPSKGSTIALPPDDMLTGDLTAPHWTVTSSGKIQVESKDDIKKRIGRSTDYGDAVVMAFFESHEISMQSWIDALKKRNDAPKIPAGNDYTY